MKLRMLFIGAGLALGLTLGAGCSCKHQNNTCTKPAVVGSVPIAQPLPAPPCNNCGPGVPVPPPGMVPQPGPPGPPPPFHPSAQSGLIVPNPY